MALIAAAVKRFNGIDFKPTLLKLCVKCRDLSCFVEWMGEGWGELGSIQSVFPDSELSPKL